MSERKEDMSKPDWMSDQEYEEALDAMASDPVRNAEEHHRNLSQDEDGDHWLDADWRRCPGCQTDNPYYQEATGK
jgi:hypothetical protein